MGFSTPSDEASQRLRPGSYSHSIVAGGLDEMS
jgi:hypothetical protein